MNRKNMRDNLRCFVGILLTVSLPLFAQTYSGGSGTDADPYQIANKADLLYLGNQTRHYDKYFIMTADIDLVGESFTHAIIGEATRAGGYFYGKKFLGSFNGNGHVIRNLTINGRNNYGFLGLFGNIGTEGSVTKLGVENVGIRGNGMDGWKVGAICGSNSGTISECYSTGDVSVQRSHVGGICGYNDSGTIINCYSSVKAVGGGWLGGGLCGYALKGNIENCYSTGWVSPTGGGLISTRLTDNPAIITGCFWDVNTSEKTSSGGGVGKTTAELHSILTFWETGWDLANIWQMNGYPSLRCFASNVPGVSIATIFITGAAVIDENTSEKYICTAVYSDGSSSNVSASVTWSEDSAFADIDTAGLLTAQSVDSDQDLAVSASYTFRGVTKTSTLNVKIWNFVPSVSISGPFELNEESSTNYTCTAVYTYGSSLDVTRQAIWSDDSDYVEISTNGLLTALSVVFDEEVTLSVSYTCGGVTKTDTHTVLIKNIPYSGGSGTAENPYLISTKADLLYLGVLTAHYSKHFILTNDIDLGDEVFRNAIIAPDDYNFSGVPFSGVFDGNGHVISNLKIDLSDLDSGYIGLFGRISGEHSEVKNLTLENVRFYKGFGGYGYPMPFYVGAMCGSLSSGQIQNCRASGSIDVRGCAGGVCGYNGRGHIAECVANVSVKGTSEVGGFCGGSYYAEFESCASYGAVYGSECVGGFIGSTVNNQIEKCFALGDVEGHYSVGGFVGDIHFGDFYECYSAGRIYGNYEVGGFVGYSPDDDFSVNSCFWDVENSGVEISAGDAYGITTAQMQDQFTFDEEGWNFYHDWKMDVFPVLQSICEEMTLSSISVSGPALVKENSVVSIKCYASFSGGRVLNVTPSALWSDNSDFVEVDTNGVAYIAEVSSDQVTVITAVYEYNGFALTNEFELFVKDIAEGALYCGGAGSEGDPWLIGTLDDLIALSTNISHYSDHFRMISDIDLDGFSLDRAFIASNEDASPYSSEFSAVEFNGVFDGRGHIVRNLRIGVVDYRGGFIGLFGCVGESGIVTSIVISNAVVGGEYLPYATGILCGENRGYISYCLVDGVVRHDQDSYNSLNSLGGVCGVNKGVFAECSADVVFDLLESGYRGLGGFVGSTVGVITNSHVVADFNHVLEASEMGGFCGQVYYGCVHSCSATMRAHCVGSRSVGAFVGENHRGSVLFSSAESDLVCGEYCNEVAGFCGANGGLVDGCLSTGIIIYGYEDQYMGLGGFCGHNNGDIKRSMSLCDIVADDVIAGAAGFCGSIYEGSIENCFCAGQISSPIGIEYSSGFISSCQLGIVSNCYSATEITTGGYYSECSGFCRSATSSIITNCFWDTDNAGVSLSAGGTGLTTLQMQIQSTFTDAGWDFVGESVNGIEDIWYILDATNSYPSFNYFRVESLIISGASVVAERESSVYTCTVNYSDGSSADVTDLALWNVECDGDVSVTGGVLSVLGVLSDQSARVTATYCGHVAAMEVDIMDIPEILLLIISGPSMIDEGTNAEYTCTAFYDDESFVDVTASASWNMYGDSASFTGHTLTALEVTSDQLVTLTLSFVGHNAFLDVLVADTDQKFMYTEGFEFGMGGWQQSSGSDIPWILNSGSTPTENTGPNAAAEGETYLYVESSGNYSSTAAIEATFDLTSATEPVLLFAYHMYGATMGNLYVEVYDGTWHEAVWSRISQQHINGADNWSQAEVDLKAYTGATNLIIRLRGVTGSLYLSDMAVDNIRLIDMAADTTVSFSVWVANEGVPVDQRDQSDSPVPDNIPNLIKYACGLSAMDVCTTADLMSIQPADSNTFSVLYYKSKAVVDVILQPIWAESLYGSWSAVDIVEKLGEDADREQWRASIPLGESGFIRLRATAE